jgi:hypothetical protein
MRRNIAPWIAGLVLLVGTPTAHGQLFETDSKRHGNPKMNIVLAGCGKTRSKDQN